MSMDNTINAIKYYLIGEVFEFDYDITIIDEDSLNYYVRMEYMGYTIDKSINKDEIERIKKLIG